MEVARHACACAALLAPTPAVYISLLASAGLKSFRLVREAGKAAPVAHVRLVLVQLASSMRRRMGMASEARP